MSEHNVSRITGASRGTWLALTVGAALLGACGFSAAQAQTPASAAAAGSQPPAAGHHRHGTNIDGPIDHLHESLQISPRQEALWHEVATVMRENAETMSRLAKARAEQAPTASAVDDLKSYAEISEAHAAGAKRMIPVFQALYDSMSAEQRKAADAEFRGHFREHAHGAHGA
jgi:periplasmic protein CpxP/Spy